MKHAWILTLLVSASALAKLTLPVEGVGACYFGPDCQGPVIGQEMTAEACSHAGGHSIRISNHCRSF